MLPCEIHGFVS